MLRRINIRQVVTLGSYPEIEIDKKKFKEYKEKINKEINKPMLQRVYPQGTVLRNVLTEKKKGKITYGRQLGTYPILVGIPGDLPEGVMMDVKVIDHGYRSITALPWPLDFRNLTPDQLRNIPGIGKKRSNQIFLENPDSLEELKMIIENKLNYNDLDLSWLYN